MAGNGGNPPTYGRYRAPGRPATQPAAPYSDSGDFLFRRYGNLDVQHQETAFVNDYGRAAFENYLNHGTIPNQPIFRANTYLNSQVFQTIDVRTPPNSNEALLGDRQARERYWAAQLRYNMEHYRRGQIGVIQMDKYRRLWGLNIRCNSDWETMRANPTPPAISMIWDDDLGEFALYCSQNGNGHFVLDGDSSA